MSTTLHILGLITLQFNTAQSQPNSEIDFPSVGVELLKIYIDRQGDDFVVRQLFMKHYDISLTHRIGDFNYRFKYRLANIEISATAELLPTYSLAQVTKGNISEQQVYPNPT